MNISGNDIFSRESPLVTPKRADTEQSPRQRDPDDSKMQILETEVNQLKNLLKRLLEDISHAMPLDL